MLHEILEICLVCKMLKYASIQNIAHRLSSRIKVMTTPGSQVLGMTGTTVGTELIEMTAEAIEEFADCYLGMIYELPLQNRHPYLNAIIEKIIVADVYTLYFPSQSESSEGDSYPSSLRQQALNEFQGLFDGLGIFIPGSTNSSNAIQNDENKTQMQSKAMLLPGETLKKYIGYDYDGDNVADTDLFKLNSNVAPSFYTTGDLDNLEVGDDVVNNVRTRPRNYRANAEYISFW